MSEAVVRSARSTTDFDDEYDVIVVGYGYAGGTTAIEAAKRGAKVLLLEKAQVPGGISLVSGGGITCARDERKAFQYLKANNNDRLPEDVVRELASGMASLEEYVRGLARINNAKIDINDNFPDSGRNYPLPGYDTWYYLRVDSIPGFDPAEAYPYASVRGGAIVFKIIQDHIAELDVTIQLNSKAIQLITDSNKNEIRGVVVERDGTERAIKATRGVVLACGGFENSKELREQFFENKPVFPVVGTNTGDGIKLAMDMGAKLWHMWHFHGAYGYRHPDPDYPYAIRMKKLPNWVPTGFDTRTGTYNHYNDTRDIPMSWILLDQYGRRYMNEYPPYLQDTAHRPMGSFEPDSQQFPRNPSYIVVDENGRKMYPLGRPTYNNPEIAYEWSDDNSKEVEIGIFEQSDSISGLAKKLDIDPETMQRSVTTWNEYCDNELDEDFGRPPGTMVPIIEPPFYGGKVWSIVTNTQGGPAHNIHYQTMNVFDEPIPRLYTVGELGSSFSQLYISGANLSECFYSGRVAGTHVANLEPW